MPERACRSPPAYPHSEKALVLYQVSSVFAFIYFKLTGCFKYIIMFIVFILPLCLYSSLYLVFQLINQLLCLNGFYCIKKVPVVLLYVELQGLTLYPDSLLINKYYLTPSSQPRVGFITVSIFQAIETQKRKVCCPK